MFKKSTDNDYLIKLAFLQATGVLGYISTLSLIFWKGEVWVGPHKFLGPILMMTLFSMSALICSLIMFYKPFKLYFDNKPQDALKLVLYSAMFLFGLFTLLLTLSIIF